MVKSIAQRDQIQAYLNITHILKIFVFKVPSLRNSYACLVSTNINALCGTDGFLTSDYQLSKRKTIVLLFMKDKLLNKDQCHLWETWVFEQLV